MTIKQKMARLILVPVLMLVPFSATYGVDWEGRPRSENVIDCRDSLVCGASCDSYRTFWQSVRCIWWD